MLLIDESEKESHGIADLYIYTLKLNFINPYIVVSEKNVTKKIQLGYHV